MESATYLTQLRQLLDRYFILDEFKTLCFDLSVDYDNVPGETKTAKIRELLLVLGRHGRLPHLITILQQERPDVDWPPVPNDFQMPGSVTGGRNENTVGGDMISTGNITNSTAAMGRGATAVLPPMNKPCTGSKRKCIATATNTPTSFCSPPVTAA